MFQFRPLLARQGFARRVTAFSPKKAVHFSQKGKVLPFCCTFSNEAAHLPPPAHLPPHRRHTAFVAVSSGGVVGDRDFAVRLQCADSSAPRSPWHDVPLRNDDGTFNMVVEVPKMTTAKMEVDLMTAGNPIVQDRSAQGALRAYHGPIFWNYGMMPQTWESPEGLTFTGLPGDSDPVDVVEIGSTGGSRVTGDVVAIRVLGALPLIDDGEMDWKIVAIAADDQIARGRDAAEISAHVPHFVWHGIREWFRWYKTPDNKPVNAFAHEGVDDAAKSEQIIQHAHEAWKHLRAAGHAKFDTGN